MLQTVASGLGNLRSEMVFVGGAVAELYATDPASSDIRPTLDVDCVIELSSRRAHADLEELLRSKGFQHDTSQGAPICRWIYKEVLVDVMPSDPQILGFSNLWYPEGIQLKVPKELPDGTTIHVFTPTHFLAAKFEAHNGRGGRDLRTSQDFEDIVYLFSNCTEILADIQRAGSSIKSYLRDQCRLLMKNPGLLEGLECALPYGSGEESTDFIVGLLQKISDIE